MSTEKERERSVELEPVERRLTAILSADVVGYTRMMAEDEEATVHTLTEYREEIARLVAASRGRIVDAEGDNLLAEFPSALDAARCAVEIQDTIAARNAELPAAHRMVFRVGVNLADVMVRGDRIYGSGINVAARLQDLAEPGGVCVSGTVYEQLENKLDARYEDLGERSVKNLAKPVRVYRVLAGEATERELATRAAARPAAAGGLAPPLRPTLPARPRSPKPRTAFSILSNLKRSGAWEPPEHLRVIHILGNAHLDFRDAAMLDGTTELSIFAVLGNARIIVPPELDVNASGSGVLGSFEHIARESGDPDMPLLRIRGLAVLGNVHIREGTAGDTFKRALRRVFG
ncbi:MAG: adenylate/guanylate cyclase domain-containing protein [Myxococcota bacterium]